MLVIVVSLALKLPVLDVAVAEDQAAALRDLGGDLGGQGYKVAVPRADLPIVRGELGECSFTARILDPHGIYRDTELLKLPPGWSVAYGWRGKWHQSLPRLGPLVEYYVARQLARFGVSAEHAPVIMVSSQGGCALPDAARIDIRVQLRRAAAH
jgi:hypothetical protein